MAFVVFKFYYYEQETEVNYTSSYLLTASHFRVKLSPHAALMPFTETDRSVPSTVHNLSLFPAAGAHALMEAALEQLTGEP